MKQSVRIRISDGRVELMGGAFRLGPGAPALVLDGKAAPLGRLRRGKGGLGEITWRGAKVELVQRCAQESAARVRVTSVLRNAIQRVVAVNQVTLFDTTELKLGPKPEEVRILEQNAYTGRVRTPRQMFTGSDGLKALDGTSGAFVSHTHTVFYNPARRSALLLGFETVDRWLPEIAGRMRAVAGRLGSGMDNVDGGAASAPQLAASGLNSEARVSAFQRFTIGFDGGDYPLRPGEELALGDYVIELGTDPLALLDRHGARIARRNDFAPPPAPFANWCSWYPYRLGVTEELVLANARAARARNLGELGLRFLQVDLGWEKDNIPTFFETNDRFSHGLEWLGTKLRKESFELGLWVGVLCVADTHPIAREHPEWLLSDAAGKPFVNYHWFWEPFCPVYSLDVSHPGAREWLRENFIALARQGVRYVKWDFAGIVTGGKLRHRHDPRLVNPRAREAVRTAFQIAQDALNTSGEPALMLDCSGTDYAGAGVMGLSYANLDTGNTGLGWRHLREVYTSYACHLFKQHWALLQPSCLVVGLPGTLEEARVRATVTFMGAGHVDIGDDLTILPEDRWQVLLATLPPNTTPARPVDLFHPIQTGTLPYLTLIKSKEKKDPKTAKLMALEAPREREPEGACVWSLPVQADWDEWTLVAVFNWTEPPIEAGSGVRLARRFKIELAQLGLSPKERFWAYEFWSGQFLGELPRPMIGEHAYRHPGDFGQPIQQSGAGWFDLGFHGPAVKLVVLRRPRSHPWPLGTTFHQSGGRELTAVRWNARTHTLSGILLRPIGETGCIMIAVPARSGSSAEEMIKLPITATGDRTKWAITLK